MNDILNNCKNLEQNDFIQMKDDIKIYSNVGFVITIDHENILKLCESNFHKDKFICKSTSELYLAYSMKSTNNNIILTQPLLIPYWVQNNVEEKYFVITSKSEINDTTFSKYNVVVMSYKMCNKLDHKIFKRIIYHNIPNVKLHESINCLFKWVVFSNREDLVEKWITDSIILPYLLFEFEYKYQSTYDIEYVYCKKPLESITLHGLVDKIIIDCLDKYDIKNALYHLTSRNIKSENDIIKTTLRTFNDILKDIEAKEFVIGNMYFANTDDKTNRLTKLIQKKKNIIDKKNQLISRITNNSICFICFNTIDITSIMKCCSNKVCFECINKWLHKQNTCPVCNKNNCSYFVIQNNENICKFDNTVLSTTNSIFDNFYITIKSLVDTEKILIVGSDNNYLSKFENILIQHNFDFIQFKGNYKTLINKLNMFKKHCNILTLDYYHHDYPIPIETVTHVIFTSQHIKQTFTISFQNLKKIWILCYP